jgi:hypothetical protein
MGLNPDDRPLDWTGWPERSGRELMAHVVGAEDPEQLTCFDIKALVAAYILCTAPSEPAGC